MPPPGAALAALACAVLLGTAACSPTGDAPSDSSTPPSASATAAPIFASDEEALAAAVEAYEAYAEASTRVANAGGEGSDAITPLVSAEFDEVVQEEFAALRESGLKMMGEAIHYNPRLDEYRLDGGYANVTVIFCRDISGTRLLRPDGSDVTPADRDLIQATRAELTAVETDSDALIVSSAKRLQDEEGC